MKNLYGDFKKFINRGNIIDMAIGIILGSAFTAIVNSLVNDVIMPLISRAIEFDLTTAKLILTPAEVDAEGNIIKTAVTLNYGQFLQYVLNFLIIALSLFVFIKIFQTVKTRNIKRKVNYVLRLKEKHPELFDEKDEVGTVLYEKIKKQHPEYFKNKDVDKIEKKEEKRDVATLQLELLQEINENLKKLNKEQNDEVKE